MGSHALPQGAFYMKMKTGRRSLKCTLQDRICGEGDLWNKIGIKDFNTSFPIYLTNCKLITTPRCTGVFISSSRLQIIESEGSSLWPAGWRIYNNSITHINRIWLVPKGLVGNWFLLMLIFPHQAEILCFHSYLALTYNALAGLSLIPESNSFASSIASRIYLKQNRSITFPRGMLARVANQAGWVGLMVNPNLT